MTDERTKLENLAIEALVNLGMLDHLRENPDPRLMEQAKRWRSGIIKRYLQNYGTPILP